VRFCVCSGARRPVRACVRVVPVRAWLVPVPVRVRRYVIPFVCVCVCVCVFKK
jgi:hypothetical protein